MGACKLRSQKQTGFVFPRHVTPGFEAPKNGIQSHNPSSRGTSYLGLEDTIPSGLPRNLRQDAGHDNGSLVALLSGAAHRPVTSRGWRLARQPSPP